MNKTVLENIDSLYKEANSASKSINAYGAALLLGEIWNCVSKMPNRVKYSWNAKISQVWREIKAPNSPRPEVQSRVDQLERILRFGDEWIFEEFVVVVGNRIDVDLVLQLFSINGASVKFALDKIKAIDKKFEELQNSTVNSRAFASARQTVKKNRRIPVDHWLLD